MSFLSKKEPDIPEEDEFEPQSEEERREEEDIDVYPESTTEFNKWLVDINPKLRNQFDQLNKELVVSNLEPEDIDRCESKLDLSYQCAEKEFEGASRFFLFKSGIVLSLNRSKGGFQVRQLGTVAQEKTITRRQDGMRKKRGIFGRFG